jgi:hypothetical protein
MAVIEQKMPADTGYGCSSSKRESPHGMMKMSIIFPFTNRVCQRDWKLEEEILILFHNVKKAIDEAQIILYQ